MTPIGLRAPGRVAAPGEFLQSGNTTPACRTRWNFLECELNDSRSGLELRDAEIFDLAVQRREADVQQFSRFLAILVSVLEHAGDMLFFELID